MRNTGMILASVIFSLILVTSIIPSYSEYLSPKKQLDSGIAPQDVICKPDRVLALRDNGNVACVREKTAEKKGWDVIATEFTLPEVTLSDQKTHVRDHTESVSISDNVELNIKDTTQIKAQLERENYLNSLQFGLISDEEFEGEVYGFDQNLHLRQPAPLSMTHNFGADHYILHENDLASGQSLDDIIPTLSTINNGATGSGGGVTVDYREWLPTWIASGYYLKWVDIRQPEDQYPTNEGKGNIKFTFVPKGLEVSEDIMNDEFVDINMYSVTVVIADEPILSMRTASEIDVTTMGGTATDIIYEDKWDGYMLYVHTSRSDPAKHGVSYDSPHISITSGGNALTMQEHESIVNELFERYSNR